MRNRAFTLVELLVVIAIISILAALLLPSLQHALSMARRTSCASLQKQIGLALMQYESDYPGYLPSFAGAYANSGANLIGIDRVGGWQGSTWIPMTGRFRSLVRWDYLPKEALYCPGNAKKVTWKAGGYVYQNDPGHLTTHPGLGVTGSWIYWGNGFIGRPSSTQTKGHYVKFSLLKNTWPLLTDAIADHNWVYYPKIESYQGAGRPNHDPDACAGGNVLYADSHVQWLNILETKNISYTGGTRIERLNCPMGPDGKAVPYLHVNSITSPIKFCTNTWGSYASDTQLRQYFQIVPH